MFLLKNMFVKELDAQTTVFKLRSGRRKKMAKYPLPPTPHSSGLAIALLRKFLWIIKSFN
jgi:hypothetical protein